MPKEEYDTLLNQEILVKDFDRRFLQEPIELDIKPLKKSRILLPGDN